MSSLFLKYNNYKIHYKVEGKEGENIVLLHGFLENLDFWGELSSELSKQHRVISVDLLGYQKIYKDGDINYMESMSEHVCFILEYLSVSNCYIFGHSMGGYVAVDFLNKYNGKIKGIALINSHTFSDDDHKITQRDEMIHLIKKGMKKRVINVSIPNMFFIKNKNNINKMKNMATMYDDDAIISTIRGMRARKDTTDLFLNFNGKKMVILGREDNTFNYSIFKDKIKDNNIKLIELETGHVSPLEDTKNTLLHIKKFIRDEN